MPPQRLIFLLQSLRKWFDTDEASEASLYRSARVRSQYLKLLSHMAPSLLEVPGSHWDYILSIVQEWLMVSSILSDQMTSLTVANNIIFLYKLADMTLPADTVVVYEALSLFATLKNMSDENEDLLSACADYNASIQEIIFDILIAEQCKLKLQCLVMLYSLLTSSTATEPTLPRLALHELLAQLLEDVPDKMVKQKSVEDDLLSIICAPSESLQKASYKLLSTNIMEQAQGLSASLEFSRSEGKFSIPFQIYLPCEALLIGVVLENPSLANFNHRLLEQILNPVSLLDWMDGEYTDKVSDNKR
jgi:hypothetical protein